MYRHPHNGLGLTDPYSALIGAIATAVGQIAQSVPAGINAANAPKLQKQQEQAQQQIALLQEQAAQTQTQAMVETAKVWAPYVGGGLGLLALAWGVSKILGSRRSNPVRRYVVRPLSRPLRRVWRAA